MCLCQLGVTPKPRVVINSSPRSLDGRKTSLEVFPGAWRAVTTKPTTRWHP